MKRMLLIRRAAGPYSRVLREETVPHFPAETAYTSVREGVWMTRMLVLSCISSYRNRPGQIPGKACIFMADDKDGWSENTMV